MNRRRFLSAVSGALLSVALPLQDLLVPLARTPVPVVPVLPAARVQWKESWEDLLDMPGITIISTPWHSADIYQEADRLYSRSLRRA